MQEKQKAAANSVASKSSFYPNKLLTNNSAINTYIKANLIRIKKNLTKEY